MNAIHSSIPVILVTGGSGFIGSNLVLRLSEQHCRTISILPPEEKIMLPHCPPNEGEGEVSPHLPLLAGESRIRVSVADLDSMDDGPWDVLFVRGDIRDRTNLFCFFQKCCDLGFSFTYVIHLAACATIQQADQDPELAKRVNVLGTQNLLDAVDFYLRNPDGSFSIRGFLYSSTDKIYGEGSQSPYLETHTINPRFPYEKSKAEADQMVLEAYKSSGLPSAVTRFCNVYGPGDIHASRIVPGSLFRILYLGKPPQLNLYQDSDGSIHSFCRDMIYIDDIIDAVFLLLHKFDQYRQAPGLQEEEPICGEAFNLGTEHCYPISEILQRIQDLTGSTVPPEKRMVSHGEILEQCMSYQKAKRAFGFRPRVGLAEGLEKTVNWYRQRRLPFEYFK